MFGSMVAPGMSLCLCRISVSSPCRGLLKLLLQPRRYMSVSPKSERRRRPNFSSSWEGDPFGKPRYNQLKSRTPNLIFDERMQMAEELLDQPEMKLAPQLFDYFLVLDFEATCDKGQVPEPQEIIEFPVLKVDSRTMQTVSTYHQYVLPKINPNLSPFCTQLTGIIQDMVDGQPNFEKTLELFDDWMNKEGLFQPGVTSAFITCGDWDLGIMLPKQAEYFRIKLPSYFKKWINLKHAFSQVVGHYPRGLRLMLESLEIMHTGREHSGIDDCRNILQIAHHLAARGHIFQTNGEKKDRNNSLYKK